MKKKLPVFLIIIVLLIVGYHFVSPYFGKMNAKMKEDKDYQNLVEWEDSLPTGIDIEAQFQRYLDLHGDEPSEIEGWTIRDKYNAGLSIDEGEPDTDHDGLTDKQEIEVYGSDPLKKSTADDLYTDGYKAEHGMDVTAYYEYEGEITYPGNTVDYVTLLTPTVYNLEADIRQLEKDHYSVENYEIHAAYIFMDYNGKLNMDLSSVLREEGLSVKDATILQGAPIGTKFVISDYQPDDNGMLMDVDMESYTVFLVAKCTSKDKTPGRSENLKFGRANANGLEDSDITGADGLVVYNMAAEAFGMIPEIYYVSTGDEEKDRSVKDALINWADTKITDGDWIRAGGTGIFNIGSNEKFNITDANCVAVSQDKLNKEKAKCQTIDNVLPGDSHITCCLWDSKTATWQDELFRYTSLDDIVQFDVAEMASESHTEQMKYDYEFPFSNFCSIISPGGNCAGIAYITSYMYNNGTLPAMTGSYDFSDNNETGIKSEYYKDKMYFNIDATAGDNADLVSGAFYDFQNADFVKTNTTKKITYNFLGEECEDIVMDTDKMGVPEQEYVYMVGCYWAFANKECKGHLRRTDDLLDYQLIRDIMNKLDHNKMLYLNIILVNAEEGTPVGGHAVNIVSYEVDPDDADTVYLYLYDSNFPHDARVGNGKVNTRNGKTYITVRREVLNDGKEIFKYEYCPGTKKMIATNEYNVYPLQEFDVYDENYQLMN